MRRTLFVLVFLFSLSVASAVDLSDYPMFSEPIQVVVGSDVPGLHSVTATDIMFTLTGYDKKAINMRLANEVSDFSTDFVLIGGPCVNAVTKHFYPDAGCTLEGSGVYYLPNGEQNVVTVVASNDDTLRELGLAVRHSSHELSGEKYTLPGAVVEEVAPVEDPAVVVAPATPTCTGCLVGSECLTNGQVTSVQGVGHYCFGTELVAQLSSGECSVDAACLSGTCDDGWCRPLASEALGFFGWIKAWFAKLF